MRYLVLLILTAMVALSATGCGHGQSKYPTTETGLQLTRVVLYRNGIGYFERAGRVEGNQLRIKVRKDQVNDLLKSLTVVKRRGGQALSISMPLDPQTWANAALATLAPGQGSLADVLDALRGTRVNLSTTQGSMAGRIVMVERIEGEPDPTARGGRNFAPPEPGIDHKVTLLDDADFHVVRLSKVRSITLEDGQLAMQFNRSLDATAGEGMFQQVDLAIRLAGADEHDLVVSYVAAAPIWKPTYRVVLPEKGKGKALLQGWAVVDNVSGEDWSDVRLALTSGAPIAFQYDLHTPRDVERTDLTESGVRKRARVAVGETSYEPEPEEPPPPPEVTAEKGEAGDEDPNDMLAADKSTGSGRGAGGLGRAKKDTKARRPTKPPPKPKAEPVGAKSRVARGAVGTTAAAESELQRAQATDQPAVAFESLRQSTIAKARATAVSGLTRFDLDQPVTVPDGSSTMVAIINTTVEAEETFLFRPGGAGVGYEANPYRVVRFRNSTPFVLEPGPISIYSGGSFVGEGLSEAVGAKNSATVPFAVEPNILVTSKTEQTGDQMKLLRIVRGVLEVESFARKTTIWSAKSRSKKKGFTVLIRHPKAGWNYALTTRPNGTEDLADGYLIPLNVPAGRYDSSVRVMEQTPSRMSLSIWDGRATKLLETLLVSSQLSPDERAKLEPIVRRRQEIGRIDTQIAGLQDQRQQLDQRASETRKNLLAIKKDPAAGKLRAKLNKRLDEFTRDADRLGREVVELQSKRLEKKIELEDLLQNLDLRAAKPTK